MLLAAAGLGAWILGLWWLGTRAITPADGLDRRQAALAGGLISLGVLAWLAGLYNA